MTLFANENYATKEDIKELKSDIRLILTKLDHLNKRFDFISKILTALVAGIFGLVGFMMWDRRTVLEKAKKECNIKADREDVERIAQALKEILNKDEYAKEIFRKYGLL